MDAFDFGLWIKCANTSTGGELGSITRKGKNAGIANGEIPAHNLTNP
jgi:hypothetical protein